MKERQLENLISPYFLVCLFVLLANDFVLKPQFHNAITGKLSDIVGLVVFSMFWCAFFPHLRLPIHLLTAVLFIFWKSPYSEPVIDGWNRLSLFSIGRTVDYSDLLALIVLPASYLFTSVRSGFAKQGWAPRMIAALSIFAFTATTYSEKTAYENEYYFPNSKKDLVLRMSYLPKNEVFEWHNDSDKFEVVFDSCISRATIGVSERNGQSVITLTEIDFRCPGGGEKEEMREFFEKRFIDELKENSGNKAPLIEYIWAERPPDPYPHVWSAFVDDPNKPDWEILPQEAKPGEVILSKRNELGILSNFAATPFELYGKRYASVEGFWQMMLYPEGPDDKRAKAKGVEWKYTREQVAQMTAFEAKSAGTLAEENMKKLGIDWCTYQGKRFPYRSATSGEHYKLIVAAMRAKAEQNPEVKRILLATGDLILKPDHHGEQNPPPEWKYNEIWMQLRSELQRSAR
jgi:predicted NAD-dependent protein-ADP-ribosyltransferase YbiA (DUF1768 family)